MKCVYCRGKLIATVTIIGETDSWGKIIPTPIPRFVCALCGCEPPTLCGECEAWTVPCNGCRAQRCLCLGEAARPAHWYGGIRILIRPPKKPTETLEKYNARPSARYS